MKKRKRMEMNEPRSCSDRVSLKNHKIIEQATTAPVDL